MSLLEVRGLEVAFENEEGDDLVVVDGVDLSLKPGQTLGLVGESGCGKSVSALSLLRLLPQPTGKILNGSIYGRVKTCLLCPPMKFGPFVGKRLE